jgi:hypothetical protein
VGDARATPARIGRRVGLGLFFCQGCWMLREAASAQLARSLPEGWKQELDELTWLIRYTNLHTGEQQLGGDPPTEPARRGVPVSEEELKPLIEEAKAMGMTEEDARLEALRQRRKRVAAFRYYMGVGDREDMDTLGVIPREQRTEDDFANGAFRRPDGIQGNTVVYHSGPGATQQAATFVAGPTELGGEPLLRWFKGYGHFVGTVVARVRRKHKNVEGDEAQFKCRFNEGSDLALPESEVREHWKEWQLSTKHGNGDGKRKGSFDLVRSRVAEGVEVDERPL